jgi:hypothetical protein
MFLEWNVSRKSITLSNSMGRTYQTITPKLKAWIHEQPMFFVATAPLDPSAHVNCSPKGLNALRVLGPREVAYTETMGSGAETIAHLRENGRIVIMLCAFQGAAKIVRLHGQGRCVLPHQPEFDKLAQRMPHIAGTRSIIAVSVTRISDSCGFGVPIASDWTQRDTLTRWAAKQSDADRAAFQAEHNARSIDGLPGV